MNNQLPIKWERNIFKRIMAFFRKDKVKSDAKEEVNLGSKISSDDNSKLNFKYEKNDVQKKQEALEDIISIIEKHPDKLETLDEQKLILINNYYTEKIAKLERKVARLKKVV